jgi:2-C-methyl-D-erythritol 4-phosphate cytidylyltransferase
MMFPLASRSLASVPRIERVFVCWPHRPPLGEPRLERAARQGRGHLLRRLAPRESVSELARALADAHAKDDWVLVHDAARPCIQKELVEQFLDEIGDTPWAGSSRSRSPTR